MARSFPADTKLQSFITEEYENERANRIAFYKLRKSGDIRNPEVRRARGSNVPDGLPKIIPMEYARNKKQQEDREREKIIQKARKNQSSVEMFNVSGEVKETLYNGFTKEEKGRYQYLNTRKEVIPEQKYSFPISSSMQYGWKLNEQFNLGRPRYARSSLIRDTFYTRNQVPTLDDPTRGVTFERSRTIFC